MSKLTPQGRLAVKLMVGVVAIVAASSVMLAVRDKEPQRPELAGVTVAQVVFSEPTDAFVLASGTEVIVADGSGWRLATFGPGGETGSRALTADEVEDGADVGGVTYVFAGGVWQPTEPVVVTDVGGGAWKIESGDAVVGVDQPSDWDEQNVAAVLAESGGAVVTARVRSGDTVVIDGMAACLVTGAWAIVAVAEPDGANTMLLRRVDDDRMNYSVSSFNRCAR